MTRTMFPILATGVLLLVSGGDNGESDTEATDPPGPSATCERHGPDRRDGDRQAHTSRFSTFDPAPWV